MANTGKSRFVIFKSPVECPMSSSSLSYHFDITFVGGNMVSGFGINDCHPEGTQLEYFQKNIVSRVRVTDSNGDVIRRWVMYLLLHNNFLGMFKSIKIKKCRELITYWGVVIVLVLQRCDSVFEKCYTNKLKICINHISFPLCFSYLPKNGLLFH